MANLHFVLFNPTQSRRDAELELARLRSHVAHKSYRRRQEQYALDSTLIRYMNGNSDPFRSSAIRITPRINQLITFIRDTAIPAKFFNSVFTGMSRNVDAKLPKNLDDARCISRCSAIREWRSVNESLHDELSALARLLAYVSLLSKASPGAAWPEKLLVQLRTRTIGAMREALSEEHPTSQAAMRFADQLHDLFFAACIEDDFLAVQIHGEMMRKQFEAGNFTYQLLTKALCTDGDFATRHGRRSILDIEEWCPRVLLPLWSATATVIPRAPTLDLDVHENITIFSLRCYVARARSIVNLLEKKPFQAKKWEERSEGDLAYGAALTTETLDCAMLNHLYLDLIDPNQVKTLCQSLGHRYTQAAIAVAVHYLKRRIADEAVISGHDYHNTKIALKHQLQDSLSKALANCTHTELVEYADAHLWSSYVGMLDGMNRSDTPNSSPDAWFAHTLKEQANTMGVVKWEQMVKVAQRFLYVEFADADGSKYYEARVKGSRVLEESN